MVPTSHIGRIAVSDQLELFSNEPFSMRLKIEDAMHIFWEHYWQFLPTAQTTKAHRKRILDHFRDRFIDTLSKADIEGFRRWLMTDQKLSAQTANKAQMLLSRMFTKILEYKEGKFAHGVDYSRLSLPTKNPCAMVPRPRAVKRAQVATQREFQRLQYYADDDMTDILNMLLYTRLRPGDLQRITSKQIDLQRGKIDLIQNKTITTKNPSGIQIIIPISQKIADILLPRLSKTKPGAQLFPFRNMQRRWKELRKRADSSHIQLRDLRRTATAFLLDSGVDPITAAQGLGHQDLTMLPTYSPRNMTHHREALSLLEKNF